MIYFLTVDQAIRVQYELIETHGGLHGIRDIGLLTSAIEVPKATFNGQDLHINHFEKAAAYAFHIIKNHPFCDGNKRTGAFLAILFLKINGIELKLDQMQYEILVIGMAEGLVTKSQMTEFLERSRQKRRPHRQRK